MVHGNSTPRSIRFFRSREGGLSRHRRPDCTLGFDVRSCPLSTALFVLPAARLSDQLRCTQ